MTSVVDYIAPKVVSQFIQSNARMRIICGPFGSGKTTGGLIDVARRAAEQKPGKDGYRRSRWAVVRNTAPMLVDTTIKSWFTWFKDGEAGWWKQTGKTFFLEFGDVKAEVIFRALDDEADVRNLLSLELTGAFIDEAREIPRAILEGLDGRIGRYPAVKDGGPTWRGIWASTNPPEEGSYWWAMMEGLDPETGLPKENSWDVYKQPGGMLEIEAPGQKTRLVPNPDADNVNMLDPGYYENLSKDKAEEYVKVYVLGKYGTSKSGKPVHPMFKESVHVANDILKPNPKLLLVISADFGRTPAMTLKQYDVFGRNLTLDEVVTEDMGLERAIKERLKPLLRNKYEGYDIFVTGDPAGNSAGQNDEKTCVTIFKDQGFKKVKFAYSNNPIYRQGATDSFLARNTDMGPAFLISPNCSYYKRGLKGGYHFKVSKNGIYSVEPEKNIYSHICEAGQYGDMYFEKGIESTDAKKQRDDLIRHSQIKSGSYTRRSS